MGSLPRHPPEWRVVSTQVFDDLPSHTAIRFAFPDKPAVEVLTPRALVTDQYVAHLASLLLEPPPPPPRPY